MLQKLDDYSLWRGYNYSRLDGSTPHEDRHRHIEEYNTPDSKKCLLILSAGGLGRGLGI